MQLQTVDMVSEVALQSQRVRAREYETRPRYVLRPSFGVLLWRARKPTGRAGGTCRSRGLLRMDSSASPLTVTNEGKRSAVRAGTVQSMNNRWEWY